MVWGRSAINCLKRGHTNSGVMTGVVVIFCPGKKLAPLLRNVRCKCPKTLFQISVGNFGLPIYLWVICGTHFQLRAHEYKQFLPESASKNWASNRNNGSWLTV
uniref:Uncharacterized protein n=1 Tax=Cannabis sativa TaxID=3483 RepID=A0A803NTC7_CANSA